MIIHKIIASILFQRLAAIDRMSENTIDELAAKADAITSVRASFDRLPAWIRTGAGNIKFSEI